MEEYYTAKWKEEMLREKAEKENLWVVENTHGKILDVFDTYEEAKEFADDNLGLWHETMIYQCL